MFSFVLPGLGQAYNGQSLLAWLFIAPVAVLGAVLGAAIMLAGSGVLSRLLDTRFLAGLIVLDVTLLGWRLAAILQAHGHREAPSARRWTTWATAAVVIVTLAMHALPAYYAAKAIDALGAVSREGGGGRHRVAGLPAATPLPVPSSQPDVRKGERVNILLVGVDALPGRTTQLTDTMLVVSLDPNGGHSAMISIPRDTYGAPLPDGQPFNQKLNALMVLADLNPAQYPDGGVSTLKQTIGGMLGVTIHYFVAVNLLGFKQAVDSVGGVDITVTRSVSDPTYINEAGERTGFYIQPGPHHMDGRTALAFARSRKGYGDSDFTRADRQQQLLEALRAKLTAGNLVTALPGLLDAVKSAIVTDIPSDKIPALAQAVQDANIASLERIVLQPPTYYSVELNNPTVGYALIPNLPAIRAIGERLLSDQPASGASASPSASP